MGALALAAFVLVAAGWIAPACAAGGSSGGAPIEAPFERVPLDPPLVLTGNFGESRSGRYHGGLDFSTGGAVGRELFAPVPGFIERLRAAGGGFGRSIYLHADDGRLIVFAHLDAFDEPMARYMDEAQSRTGDYEQDLWPGRDRFRVRAGQRIGWTGESGAGPPHLHMEVRRGDVAYNPLRAGMVIEDGTAPVLRRLTLEPLDGRSWVERSPEPWTLELRGGADTLVVEGRVRAIVEARDGANGNGLRLAPWSTGVTFGGMTIACQFDSARWGGDMADADYVYDHGRSGPGNGVVLWHAGPFRPTVILGGHGMADAALEVKPGDPPRALEVSAVDVAGHRATHTLWLRGPSPGEEGPDTTRTGPPGNARGRSGMFELAVLPQRNVRVTFHEAPAGSRGVRVCGAAAVWNAGRWTAIVPFDSVLVRTVPVGSRERGAARLEAAGLDAAGASWSRSEQPHAQADDGPRWSFSPAGPFEWWLDSDAVYEPALLLRAREGTPLGTSELVPVSDAWTIEPSALPLRADVQIRIALPGGVQPERVDMYRSAGRVWNALGAAWDSGGRSFQTGTRTLGRFALLADTLAPRIRLLRPRGRSGAPYSRWALEASVQETGSGVERRASWFEVNGKRVPSEWDAERRRLRWRPARRPAPGTYVCDVVVTDAAGNVRREQGRFVLN